MKKFILTTAILSGLLSLKAQKIPVPTQNPESGCWPDSPDCYPPPPPPKPKVVAEYPGGPTCRCGCNIPTNRCACHQSPSSDAKCKVKTN